MAHWYRSGDTHLLIYSDTPGVTNIKGHSADNTNKGARTLSYGPVRVVSYLSYRTYSQHRALRLLSVLRRKDAPGTTLSTVVFSQLARNSWQDKKLGSASEQFMVS